MHQTTLLIVCVLNAMASATLFAKLKRKNGRNKHIAIMLYFVPVILFLTEGVLLLGAKKLNPVYREHLLLIDTLSLLALFIIFAFYIIEGEVKFKSLALLLVIVIGFVPLWISGYNVYYLTMVIWINPESMIVFDSSGITAFLDEFLIGFFTGLLGTVITSYVLKETH